MEAKHTLRHHQRQEAYNIGWNMGRWNEPRNCPYFDRARRGEYVEGYNDGRAAAKGERTPSPTPQDERSAHTPGPASDDLRRAKE